MISFLFILLYSNDIFTSIIPENLYSDIHRIEDCPLNCNLAEITQIRYLPGQFWRMRTTVWNKSIR